MGDTLAKDAAAPAARVISIRVLNGIGFKKELETPGSHFNKHNQTFILSHPALIKRLNASKALIDGESVLAQDIGITFDDLRDMGGGAYNLWLKMTVPDSQGKNVEVDSREFIAWQRNDPKYPKDYTKEPIDVWAKAKGIALVSQARKITAGDQAYNIEWDEGTSRITGDHEAIISKKREGYYGEIVIPGPDGNPVRRADGLPDIFLTKPVYEQLVKGQPYQGPVVIQDLQGKNGKFDEIKIFFGTENKKNSQELEASSFKSPEEFKTYIGDSRYHEISYPQFQAWKYDTSQHPENADASFESWVHKNWGTRERFDGIFAKMESITQDEYRHIATIAAGADKIVNTKDDPSTDEIRKKLLPFIQSAAPVAIR